MNDQQTETGNDQLDGSWQVERTSGLLPPLYGVRKQIAHGQGWTQLGPIPLLAFDVVGLELRYRRPLHLLIDVLRHDGLDSYSGSTTLAGKQIGTFTMFRPTARRKLAHRRPTHQNVRPQKERPRQPQ